MKQLFNYLDYILKETVNCVRLFGYFVVDVLAGQPELPQWGQFFEAAGGLRGGLRGDINWEVPNVSSRL